MSAIKQWTIYCHTHIESGRCYIGLTSRTMEKRWKDHIRYSRTLKGTPSYFANAIMKYGPEAFYHKVLEICISLSDANDAEKVWIEAFSAQNPEFGFNLTKGGNYFPTTDGYQKISENSKRLWQNPEYRAVVTAKANREIRKPEKRQMASEGTKKSWQNPEYRNKVIKSNQITRKNPILCSKLSDLWKDSDYREKCLTGPRAHNEFLKSKTHCKNGHLLNSSRKRSEGCKFCNNDRRRAAKTHCPKGHKYDPENIKLRPNGSRICIACKMTHCPKCGNQKFLITGRMRCKPCDKIYRQNRAIKLKTIITIPSDD